MKNPFDSTTATLATCSLACLVVLGGCGPQNGEPVPPAAPVAATAAVPARTAPPPAAVAVAPRPVPSAHLGEVSHIETLIERPKNSPVGAVAGGVLGAVVGHQIGSGDGNKIATVGGGVGGALLGNKIGRDRGEKIVGYRIDVRLDNGDTRSFQQTQLDGRRVGERVRIDSGQVRPA